MDNIIAVNNLSDLRTGMHVILRNGNEYVILKDDDGVCAVNRSDCKMVFISLVEDGSWFDEDSFNEDLTCEGYPEWDIVKVTQPLYVCDILSSKKLNINKHSRNSFVEVYPNPIKKMTLEDIEKELGHKFILVNEEGDTIV